MALTTVASLKNFLGIPFGDTSNDLLLLQLIDFATDTIEQYCGRKFEQQTYTEFYDGTNTPYLLLRQRPVQSIVNIWHDPDGYYGDGPNAFATNTLLVSGSDYGLSRDDGVQSKSGIVKRLTATFMFGRATLTQPLREAVWTKGIGNLKVTYVAGYSPIPPTLELAANYAVRFIQNYASTAGLILNSENLAEAGYSILAPGNFPLELQAILRRFKEKVI